jgi:hypothetical protein
MSERPMKGSLQATPSALASANMWPSDKPPSAALTVETAAIWIGGQAFTLPRPNRHHNVLYWLAALGVPTRATHEQGFVLSDGSYATREQAAKVALAAGQVAQLHAPPRLFSEDLWKGGAGLPSYSDILELAAARCQHLAPSGSCHLDYAECGYPGCASTEHGAGNLNAPAERP